MYMTTSPLRPSVPCQLKRRRDRQTSWRRIHTRFSLARYPQLTLFTCATSKEGLRNGVAVLVAYAPITATTHLLPFDMVLNTFFMLLADFSAKRSRVSPWAFSPQGVYVWCVPSKRHVQC